MFGINFCLGYFSLSNIWTYNPFKRMKLSIFNSIMHAASNTSRNQHEICEKEVLWDLFKKNLFVSWTWVTSIHIYNSLSYILNNFPEQPCINQVLIRKIKLAVDSFPHPFDRPGSIDQNHPVYEFSTIINSLFNEFRWEKKSRHFKETSSSWLLLSLTIFSAKHCDTF